MLLKMSVSKILAQGHLWYFKTTKIVQTAPMKFTGAKDPVKYTFFALKGDHKL